MNARVTGGEHKKTSISDHSITQHIHFIFERAVRKFSDDLDLWNQYFEYCIQQDANRMLSKAFPRYEHRVVLWTAWLLFLHVCTDALSHSQQSCVFMAQRAFVASERCLVVAQGCCVGV